MVENYTQVCTLLSPSLEMPPPEWWDTHAPDLRRKMGGGPFAPTGAENKQFDMAFSDVWTLQMDARLMDFASERAEVKQQKQVAKLTPEDLIA